MKTKAIGILIVVLIVLSLSAMAFVGSFGDEAGFVIEPNEPTQYPLQFQRVP